MTPEQQAALARARARLAEQSEAAAPAAPAAPAGPDGFLTPEQLEQWRASNSPRAGLAPFMEGATLGFGSELEGVEGALLGRTPEGGVFDYSQPFGERYEANRDAYSANLDAVREESPVASTASELAGAVLTGGGAARAGLTLMRPGLSVGGMAARGGLEGALYGALYGAGTNEDNRLEGAAVGGAAGAATGGLLSGGLGVGQALMRSSRASAAAPATDAIKRQAQAAYDRARAVDPPFPGFDSYAMDVYRVLPQEGFDPVLHPQLARWVEFVEDLSQGGTAPTLSQLEILRRRLGAATDTFTNPDQQRLAKIARQALDTYMETSARRAGTANVPVPANSAGPITPQQMAMDDVAEGRQMWGRFKRSEMIDTAFRAAELRAASTGSGGNVENAIRQELRKILLNPRKVASFNAEERAAMERAVEGDGLQNVLRLFGKLSPQGNGLMLSMTGVLPAAAAGTTGNPLFLAPAAVGGVSKLAADNMQRAAIRNVSSLVRSGGQPAALRPPLAINNTTQGLIDAISGYLGGTAGTTVTP